MRRLAALLLVTTCAACGWHAGLVAPEGYRTVGVEVLATERGVLERNLEPLLSDALSDALLDRVQAPLATPADADLVLRARVTDYHRRAGVRAPDNDLVEGGLFVLVAAELIDRRSGAVVVPSRQRHVWSGYALDASARQNEEAARRRALRHLADTLVLDLFGNGGIPATAADEGSPAGEPAGSGPQDRAAD